MLREDLVRPGEIFVYPCTFQYIPEFLGQINHKHYGDQVDAAAIQSNQQIPQVFFDMFSIV